MRIVITGANGMLGKSLQKTLIDHEVIQHTRFVSDLSRVSEAWKFYKFINDVKPDYVVHTAAMVGGLNFNASHPYDCSVANNMINGVVLDACVEAKINRFLGIASVCCYGDGFDESEYPLTEDKLFDRKPHPTNAGYAYSKRTLISNILAANKQYDRKYNYIIPANLYGEHDSRGVGAHFCSIMIDKLLTAVRENEKEIVFIGNGNAARQYIYVDDLSKIIKQHIELDIDANYNVASDEELTAQAMINILMTHVGHRLETRFTDTMSAGQIKRTVSTKLLKELYPNFEFTWFSDGVSQVYRKWERAETSCRHQ